MKEHTSSHVEDLCIGEDQTTTYEDDGTSIRKGHTNDSSSKSTKDEDAVVCSTYDDYSVIEDFGY